MVLTLDFQGAFFTDTRLQNAIHGSDYEFDPLYVYIDSLPQPNTGVGSANIEGNIMVNGSPFDDNVPLQEGDQIVFTISGNASAGGVGSHYLAFYENEAQIHGSVSGDDNFEFPSLTFLLDWNVLLTATLDAEPANGRANGYSEGSTDGTWLWGDIGQGFAFGDVADGVPTMPEDMASGQIQIVTNFGDQDFLFGLNNSATVRAEGSAIPEPTTALLLGIGLGGLALQGRRRAEPGLVEQGVHHPLDACAAKPGPERDQQVEREAPKTATCSSVASSPSSDTTSGTCAERGALDGGHRKNSWVLA